jgi:hypothetical protein
MLYVLCTRDNRSKEYCPWLRVKVYCKHSRSRVKEYKTNVDVMYLRKADFKRESTVMLHGRRKAAAFSDRTSFLTIISPIQTVTAGYFTTPLPMRYASMGYISMGFISMGYTSTGHFKF